METPNMDFYVKYDSDKVSSTDSPILQTNEDAILHSEHFEKLRRIESEFKEPQVLNTMSELYSHKNFPTLVLNDENVIFARDIVEDNEREEKNAEEPQMRKKLLYFQLWDSKMGYEEDHHKYDKELESKHSLPKNFLKRIPITEAQREISLEYLLKLCTLFMITEEKLHQTVAIFDRFLLKSTQIPAEFLQLVIVATLRIVLKLEHRRVDQPNSHNFAMLCDQFSAEHMVLMERKICFNLDFDLICPTSISFLRTYNKTAGVSVLQNKLRMYLLELSFLNHKTCAVKPSLLAASAVCLSVALLDRKSSFEEFWCTKMENATSYKMEKMKAVMREMIKALVLVREAGLNSFLYTKYSEIGHFYISTFQQVLEPEFLSNCL